MVWRSRKEDSPAGPAWLNDCLVTAQARGYEGVARSSFGLGFRVASTNFEAAYNVQHPEKPASADVLFVGRSTWVVEGLSPDTARQELKDAAQKWVDPASTQGWAVKVGFPPKGTWVTGGLRAYKVDALCNPPGWTQGATSVVMPTSGVGVVVRPWTTNDQKGKHTALAKPLRSPANPISDPWHSGNDPWSSSLGTSSTGAVGSTSSPQNATEPATNTRLNDIVQQVQAFNDRLDKRDKQLDDRLVRQDSKITEGFKSLEQRWTRR